MKSISTLTNYSQALEWINTKAKEYGSKNAFFSSSEYKIAYPKIKKLQKQAQTDFSEYAKSELKKSGLKIGDKVRYGYVGLFFNATEYSGVLIERNSIPYVKLDETIKGKKSIRWHKGFIKS